MHTTQQVLAHCSELSKLFYFGCVHNAVDAKNFDSYFYWNTFLKTNQISVSLVCNIALHEGHIRDMTKEKVEKERGA